MRKREIAWILLMAAACWHSAILIAQAQFVDATLTNAARVGTVVDGAGRPVASCFYVDKRGFVATSFEAVRGAKTATIRFNGGSQFPVAGVVAAAKGKDIVILALRGFSENTEPLTLNPETAPAIGDSLVQWGGALLPPAKPHAIGQTANAGATRWEPNSQTLILPKLARLVRGDEYLQGLTKLPLDPCGTDPDLQWMWLDQPRHRDCAGGPVFDRLGDVVGMVSSSLHSEMESYAAIHIKHVTALIPVEAPPKPHALAALASWTDPLPMAGEPHTANAKALGSRLQRGLPLADRFRDLHQRLVTVEQESAELEKSLAKSKARRFELAAEIQALVDKIDQAVPSETFTEEETETRTVRGKDGKTEKKKVLVEVTRRRFSADQQTELQKVGNDLRKKRVEFESNELQAAYDTAVTRQYLEQFQRCLREEVFSLADPLGLRPGSEHEALVATLTESIDEGGAPGLYYVVRAMSRATLGDFPAASADLTEALDADAKLKPLVSAVDARVRLLSGNMGDGAKALTKALTEAKHDSRVLLLAARIELDRANSTSAVRFLQKALTDSNDPLEVKLGLAWLYATGTVASPPLAIKTAEEAVRVTAGYDWSALAALATAQGLAKNFDEASKVMEAAINVAPPSGAAMCRTWQEQLAARQPIKRLWK